MNFFKDAINSKIDVYLNRRNGYFLFFSVLAFLMAYAPVAFLISSTRNGEYYSHIPLIPLVSMYLIYQGRKSIVETQEYAFSAGIPVLLIGAVLYFLGQILDGRLSPGDITSLIALSAVFFLNGAFILCYGVHSFKAAAFPLLFLVFIIPIPIMLMDSIIYFLQIGSTEFTNILLSATGVPFLREGFVFHLPSISVEVAKECSGIRSSLALFITALLAGHLFLRTSWKKVVLAVVTLPIAMFKNGIRIVTLTLLGTYVDPRILQSSLHREGGIPFFIVALLLMAPILYYLRRGEKKTDAM